MAITLESNQLRGRIARRLVWGGAAFLMLLAVCLYAWYAGLGHVFVFTGVMCALWIASARLFHHAAKAGPGSPIMRDP